MQTKVDSLAYYASTSIATLLQNSKYERRMILFFSNVNHYPIMSVHWKAL